MNINQKIYQLASTPFVLRIPYFVLTISIIVTLAISYFYYSSAKTNDYERFQSETLRVKGEIESRLDTYIALLSSGRSFLYAVEKIDKEKFGQFVGNLNLRQNYPGVLAIGYSKIFQPDETESLIKMMRSEGVTDFTIQADSSRDEHQAIIFIEPLDERNKKVLGFDMSSEPIRKEAIENARDSGVQSISGKVILMQENEQDKKFGFLIYFPVYKNKVTPPTLSERRKDIEGFVYSPFRAEDFINDVIKNSEIDDISFQIYDNEFNNNNFLVGGNENNKINDIFFSGENEIRIGGRKWIVTYSPTSKFYKHSLTWWTPIIFLLGLAISVVLFYLSLSQSKTNQSLLKTAFELSKTGENEKKAREKAEKSAKVKDEFLTTVSHELRTPLNAISGWINIIKMDGVERETKEKAINIINKNLRQQVNLIDQMIIFSDMETFLEQTNWQKFVINELLTQSLNEMIVQISKKKINLTNNLPVENLTIYGDKEKIKKAITILLDNSIKFTPEEGDIKLSLYANNNSVLVKIVDSGEGISPELMPNIFEGFRQSDSSSIRKYGGLGLSLAIAKKIIESHKGSIKVESEGSNLGTTIIVSFPLY